MRPLRNWEGPDEDSDLWALGVTRMAPDLSLLRCPGAISLIDDTVECIHFDMALY